MSRPPKWTAAQVRDAIRHSFGIARSDLVQEEWALLEEVALRSPTAHRTNERRIDMLAVRAWSGKPHGHERLGIEVKVSVSDYRNETDPKRKPTWDSCHRCCYAAPGGLIDPATLPTGWGLMEVWSTLRDAKAAGATRWVGASHMDAFRAQHAPQHDDLGPVATWTRTATRHTPTADLDYLVAAASRQASRLAERMRRGESEAAQVATLRHDLARAQAALARKDEVIKRERARAKVARDMLAAAEGGQTCADCGQPIRYRWRGYGDGQWQHVNPLHEDPCRPIRVEREAVARARDIAAGYLPSYWTVIEPAALRAQDDALEAPARTG